MHEAFEPAFSKATASWYSDPEGWARRLAMDMFKAGQQASRPLTISRVLESAVIWEAIMTLTHGRIFDPRKPEDRSLIAKRDSAEENLRQAIRAYSDGE